MLNRPEEACLKPQVHPDWANFPLNSAVIKKPQPRLWLNAEYLVNMVRSCNKNRLFSWIFSYGVPLRLQAGPSPKKKENKKNENVRSQIAVPRYN